MITDRLSALEEVAVAANVLRMARDLENQGRPSFITVPAAFAQLFEKLDVLATFPPDADPR